MQVAETEVPVAHGRAAPQARAAVAAMLCAVALAPGFFFVSYYGWLTLLLLIGLLGIVLRAYLVAVVSIRQAAPMAPLVADWPLVSVLVPVYNEASVLPRTVSSMLAVDYPRDRIEFVYVLERRSRDGTGEILRRFAGVDSRVRVVERDSLKGGKAAATNFGIPYCQGAIIFSLDADHSLAPDAVKRTVSHFIRDPEIVCLKGRCIGINGRESLLALLAKVERDAAEKGDLYSRHLLRGFTIFGGGQAAFRRSIFEDLGYFDEEILVEDIDFSVRIHEAGKKLVVDPRVISYEENPSTLQSWWAQRYRWARGWMQVARKYIPRVHRMQHVPSRVKVDMYHTLAYVVVPVALVLLAPLVVLGAMGFATAPPVAPQLASAVWTFATAAAFVLNVSVWLQDVRDGQRRAGRELLALLLFWPYLLFQSLVFLAAFVDEYVFRLPSVYVKTTKTGLVSDVPQDASSTG